MHPDSYPLPCATEREFEALRDTMKVEKNFLPTYAEGWRWARGDVEEDGIAASASLGRLSNRRACCLPPAGWPRTAGSAYRAWQ